MLSKTFTTAALALAASTLVSAQTQTDCNPLEKTCPADPAFGKSGGKCDWAGADCDIFHNLPGTTIKRTSDGAVFSISTEKEAPTIRTGKYLFFGRIDVVVKAAAGAGIVTSAVLQSDDLDEVDWEWIGNDNAQVQTNYFSKGNVATYDRGAFHPVSDPVNSFHTYSIEWTSAGVTWLIDGNTVRVLNAANAQGGAAGLPQTPMQVKLGTWVAGRKDAPKDTVSWAGGYADFSKAPFLGYYKSISIVDYAGADGPTDKSVKEYIYGDHSGSWESIKVVLGDGNNDDDNHSSSAQSSKTSAAPSSTKASSAASSTTPEGTSSTPESTSATATATPTHSTGGNSGNGTVSSTGSTQPTKPPTVPDNAGSRSAVTFGSVFAVGAGIALAQFLL
ncbi:glycoside hydrolase family 16 protein [Trichoderma barbatum]